MKRVKIDFCKNEVKIDCRELLSQFQQSESVRYETFCSIWRENKFADIFRGPMEALERRDFSQHILATAYNFFLPPYTFQIRVGALYLLHALYQTQHCSPKEKIRLCLKDWQDVKKFERDAVEAQHFDVVYIFNKLLWEKAFLFTAFSKQVEFEKKKGPEKRTLSEDFLAAALGPQELVSVDLLEELSNIHKHYERMKTSIGSPSDQSESSLHVVSQDLVPNLRSTVMEYYKWQRLRPAPDREAEVSDAGTSAQQECSRRADILAAIKSKSYSQAYEVSKARRHRQVEIELTSQDPAPGKQSIYRKTKKPSLRDRTQKNVVIRGNLVKETTTTTTVRQLSVSADHPDIPRHFKKFKWR